MCGLAGILNDPARVPDPGALAVMARALAHRGPDAEGLWADGPAGLAHRRLSIIDLAGGDQPIANEDGSVHVVFNGEIYNYRQLRNRLEKAGHAFRTHSDTEVLVHLYEDLGEDLVHPLRGMFAFALWDARQRLLLLARDRVGIKPLYYGRHDGAWLFASEPKALLAHPGMPRDLDPAALEDYLALGMVPGGRCIFRHLHKLPPGHLLTLRPGQPTAEPRRYWRLRIEPDEKPSAEEWVEAVRAKVAEAVRVHLIADVPVGAFLSGGIDSSAVVTEAAGPVGQASRLAGEMQTFSIGFREEAFSELPHARRIAERFGTRHVEEVVTPDAVSLLDDLSLYFDEPFADSSALPTFLVSALAARHVKVVLSGDGGDEAFGGYRRYAHDLAEGRLRKRLPGWLRRGVLGPLARAWPRADWLPRPLRAKTLLTNLALDPAAAYANTLSVCRPPLRRRLLAPDVAAALDGHDPGRSLCDEHALAPAGDDLAGMIAADTAVILPDDFLVKVDRASMAHGLEVRPPLLDHELLELAARIPSRYKVHRGQTKWVLKEAYRDRLPDDILRRPKQGFEIPTDAWLRGPLRGRFEDTVLTPGARVAGLISRPTARKLFDAHLRGTGRHGAVLWSLLVLASWAERYLSPGGVPALTHA
jgi:asparagine synthase (glutamine-hydrolysing)